MKYDLQMVGTDAEVFLYEKGSRKPIPVIGKLGGTKIHPLPVKELGNGYCVQEDNVMAEFNVPPSDSATKFSESIGLMLAYLRREMNEQDLTLAISPSMFFNKKQLKHPQAQTFGCDPDICAWTSEYNEINLGDPLLEIMRTAAAHIHVSYTVDGERPKDVASRELAVRAHDLFVGVPGVIIDTDTSRRKIYGKAGAYRVTNYGHEYRTPSNFWITTPERREWVFRQTRAALYFASTADGRDILINDDKTMTQIQDCINGHDLVMADWLCREYSVSLVE